MTAPGVGYKYYLYSSSLCLSLPLPHTLTLPCNMLDHTATPFTTRPPLPRHDAVTDTPSRPLLTCPHRTLTHTTASTLTLTFMLLTLLQPLIATTATTSNDHCSVMYHCLVHTTHRPPYHTTHVTSHQSTLISPFSTSSLSIHIIQSTNISLSTSPQLSQSPLRQCTLNIHLLHGV